MVQWLELCDGSISDQGVKILYTVSQPKKLKQTNKQTKNNRTQSQFKVFFFFFSKVLNFWIQQSKIQPLEKQLVISL